MMRLVLVLLALNLLYLGWSQWIDRNDPEWAIAATPSYRRAAAAAAATPGTDLAPPCTTVGPFSDHLLALQVARTLEADGLAVQSRDAGEMQHAGWWVHVDNTDEQQQSRTYNALHRAGIRDASVMQDDPRFSVSVGVFTSEDRARDRAAQVQRLKLEPLVTERLREQALTWLDVPGITTEALRDGRLAAADAAVDKLRVEACPVATPVPPAEAAADIIPAP